MKQAGRQKKWARRVKEGKPAGPGTPPGWGGPGGELRGRVSCLTGDRAPLTCRCC
jgi:hypothetical protein